eukprot:COSAG01_NODE_809_length_13431_cov_12.268677_16_plen_297_part_00
MARTKKRRTKRRKAKRRMPMERSKLPANRVVSANQYLHLQRRMDEMQGLKLGKTRANRRSDYARSHGIVNIINVGAGTGTASRTGFQSLGAGEKEALDMLRNAPDGLTPAEKRKKHQDREQAYYDRVRESFGPDAAGGDVATPTPSRRRASSVDFGSFGGESALRPLNLEGEGALNVVPQAVAALYRREKEDKEREQQLESMRRARQEPQPASDRTPQQSFGATRILQDLHGSILYTTGKKDAALTIQKFHRGGVVRQAKKDEEVEKRRARLAQIGVVTSLTQDPRVFFVDQIRRG